MSSGPKYASIVHTAKPLAQASSRHTAQLVALEKEHALLLQQWLSQPSILATATLEVAAPWSLRKAEKLIEQNEDSHTGYMFGVLCAECGSLIGFASLGFIDWKNRSGYVGLVIGDSSHRGLGIGKQSLSLLLDFAFNELALHRVYGEVLATNKISARMVDSLGFALEGIKREACFRDGVFLDVYIYGLLAREWSTKKEGGFHG